MCKLLLGAVVGLIAFAGFTLADTLTPGHQLVTLGDFKFNIAQEGVLYTLPEFVIAGDVVLCEDGQAATLGTSCVGSDIVHFFDTTGFGTGNMVETFTPANDLGDANDVLFPFLTLSSNAGAINEVVNEKTEVTTYIAGNNTYRIVSDVPEPSAWMLVGPGLLGIGLLRRRSSSRV